MATINEDSRYKGTLVTQFEFQGELRDYVLLKKPISVPEGENDIYVTLDEQNQFRPDILSFQVYGDPNFGWAIMEINDIRSFVELKRGVRLRIAPIESVRAAIPEAVNV